MNTFFLFGVVLFHDLPNLVLLLLDPAGFWSSAAVDFIKGKIAWKPCLVKRKTHLSVALPNSHLSSRSCLTQVTISGQQHKPDIFYWCNASFFRTCLMTYFRPVAFIQRALHLLCGVPFKIQSCLNGLHACTDGWKLP